MVPHSEYTSHQEQCAHRLLSCPGSKADHDVSFCGLEEHIKTCTGFSGDFSKDSDVLEFFVPKV